MNYMVVNKCSSVDFKGISVVLAVAGCSHKCNSCWVKSAGWWKHTSGQPFDEDAYQELYEAASKPYISNVVIQGGDGLFHKNVHDTIKLCQRLRYDLPDRKIVLFTGYTLEQIQNDLLRQPILDTIDVLIDGKFEIGLSKNPPPFRGSSNQRVIHLENGIPVRFE